VEELSKKEAESITEMRKLKFKVAEELRNYSIDPKQESDFRNHPDAPLWLRILPATEDRALAIEQRERRKEEEEEKQRLRLEAKAKMLQNDESVKQKDNENDMGIDYLKVADHNFLQKGKFGPDIQKFVLTLPPSFPTRAGKQAHALRHQLALYVTLRKKMEQIGIPRNMTSAQEPPFWKRWKLFERYIRTDVYLYTRTRAFCAFIVSQ
jgi:hypothetical protein